MRFIVYDLGDKQRRLSADWTTWRATLELLSRHQVIDKTELNRLVWRLGGAGTSIPKAEATAIADYLSNRLIPTLGPGEAVQVDGETEFDAVTGGTTFFDPTTLRDLGPSGRSVRLRLEWLEEFAQLCRSSNGIGALQEGVENTRRTLRDQTIGRGWRRRTTR